MMVILFKTVNFYVLHLTTSVLLYHISEYVMTVANVKQRCPAFPPCYPCRSVMFSNIYVC